MHKHREPINYMISWNGGLATSKNRKVLRSQVASLDCASIYGCSSQKHDLHLPGLLKLLIFFIQMPPHEVKKGEHLSMFFTYVRYERFAKPTVVCIQL